MSLRLICGPTGAGKTHLAIEAFLKSLDAGENPVFIAPSMPDARHFERQILRQRGGSIVTGGRVTTFIGLCNELLKAGQASPRQISEVERHLLMRAVVDSLDLRFLKESSRYDGFIHSLCALIAELQIAGIDPPDLAESAKGIVEPQLNAELFCIYKEYRAALEDQEAIDQEAAQRLALTLLEQHADLMSYHSVIVDGFYDFTPLQKDMLLFMAAAPQELLVTLPQFPDNAALNYPSLVFPELLECAEPFFLEVRPEHVRPTPLLHLDRYLFADSTQKESSELSIRQMEGSGVRGQAELVAAEILALFHENQDMDKIAVVFRSLGPDALSMASAFREFGIPFDFQGTIRLCDTPVGQAAIAALEYLLAESEYLRAARSSNAEALSMVKTPRECLLRYLRSALPVADHHVVDDFARKVVLRGDDDPAELMKLWRTISGNELSGLANLKAAAGGGVSALGFELCRSLRQLMGADGHWFAPAREAMEVQDDMSLDIFSLKAVIEVCREAEALQKHSSAGAPETLKLLQSGLLEASIRPPSGQKRGCVRILDPHRILNLDFEIVFICSLVEGRLPALGKDDPFLSETARSRLRADRGCRIGTNEHRLDQERFLFHRALTRASKAVYLCHPYCSADGKENVRSLFVDETLELFEKLEPGRRHRPISEVTFAPKDAPTEQQALRSLCLIAGESRSSASSSLFTAITKKLNESAAAAGLTGRLADCIARKEPSAAVLKDSANLAILSSRESFSATELETYAGCPFGYFMDRLIKPALMASDTYFMDRGTIAHEVLAEFGRKMKYAGVQLGRADRKQLEAAHQQMDGILAEHCDGLGDDLKSQELKTTLSYYLHRYINKEARGAGALQPALFECSFDLNHKENALQHRQAELNLGEGLRLRGKIDRVDIDPDNKKAAVIDYKMSAKITAGNKFQEQGKIQIMLYMCAVRDIWELEPIGGQYYALMADNANIRRGIWMAGQDDVLGTSPVTPSDVFPPEKIQELLDDARLSAVGLAQRIRAGRFEPDPQGDACSYCDYRGICRF